MISNQSRARAFTLIELILSLGVLAVLLVVIVGTLGATARAVPTDVKARSAVGVAGPLGDFASEISLATEILETTVSSVTFTVADRDKDNVPETVVYSWGGRGSPLQRRMNAGKTADVTVPLQEFQFQLNTEVVNEAAVGAVVEGSEQLLAGYMGEERSSRRTGSTLWLGQYFLPLLPTDATAYSLTRVRVLCHSNEDWGGSSVWSIRPDNGGTPSLVVLQSRSMSSGSFRDGSPPGWYEVSFSSVTNIAPTAGLWLVIGQTVGRTCEVSTTNSNVPNRREGLVNSTNLGISWTQEPAATVKYEVYGTVKRPSATTVAVTRGRSMSVAALAVDGREICQRSARLVGFPRLVTPGSGGVVDGAGGLVGSILDGLFGGGK